MTTPRIVFDNVSRFYGEVLGVNRVNLSIQPGITSLVGPNGSGKTTLMNLMTGLIRPSRGAINGVLRTQWGNLLNLSHLIGAVWASLFEQPMHRGTGAVFFRVHGDETPIWCCWVSLLVICGFCLYLLSRKIRGAEVVR